jgi:hypothetical protein
MTRGRRCDDRIRVLGRCRGKSRADASPATAAQQQKRGKHVFFGHWVHGGMIGVSPSAICQPNLLMAVRLGETSPIYDSGLFPRKISQLALHCADFVKFGEWTYRYIPTPL